jgi:hypothetical protein
VISLVLMLMRLPKLCYSACCHTTTIQ